MATPNSTYTEIVAITLEHRSGELADSVSESTALLSRLKSKGNAKLVSGGRTLVEEIMYGENSTFQYYSGAEQLNVGASENISAAEFAWKQASVAVFATGLEIDIQNAGPDQVIDLLESRIKIAEKTMDNNISTGVYSAGTGSSGKQIGGLQALVPDDPTTGTVGGINRATAANAFWRTKKYSGVTDGGTAVSSANIENYMLALYVQLCRGREHPDLAVADNSYWIMYHQALNSRSRIMDEKMGKSGFSSLKFMGMDVVLDGGYGGDAPTAHMWMLNTDYLFFKTHKDRNFVPLNPDRHAVNQDALVKLIAWAGNMTISAGWPHGVLIA